jgi:hypothetical protein
MREELGGYLSLLWPETPCKFPKGPGCAFLSDPFRYGGFQQSLHFLVLDPWGLVKEGESAHILAS